MMKIQFLTFLLFLTSITVALPPTSPNPDAISSRDDTSQSSYNALEKRKGGGGGKGGSGGRSSGGTSSASGRPLSSYSFSSSSNAGGRTVSGSGSPTAYGNRYAGGAAVPYTSGGKSPTRGIAPYALPIAAVAIFPALWLYPVYAYPYGYGYHWYGNGRNQTSNVTCLCQEYSVCGCDPNDNSTFVEQVLTNGSMNGGAPVNTSLVRTVDYGNGTVNSYINGTLDNGTTASGGTDPSDESEISAAMRLASSYVGYWVMIATVICGVMMV